jgi:SAM-dependent methyltransferase
MSATMLAKGLATWIPGVYRALFNPHAGAGTASAPYCYGVWVKHLALLSAHGMRDVPRSVLELGPGETLGTGIAALLSGAERYVAVDKVLHVRAAANLSVFWELTQMLRSRAPRPHAGFPPFEEHLDERLFPGRILSEGVLEAALHPDRLARIEDALRAVAGRRQQDMIRYESWDDLKPIEPASADLALSHVVMNHVDDLEGAYRALGRWVRPGGWMSHQIDFTSLGTAEEWNGHRKYGELAWKVIAGKRPYFVNREPLETHLRLMDRNGFDIAHLIRGRKAGGIARSALAPRWRGMSDDDFTTQTAFVVARRRRP